MKTLKRCDLCGKDKFKFLFKAKDAMFKLPGDYFEYECENCGLIFINPQPDKKKLSEHYPKGEYYSANQIKIKNRYLQIYKNIYSKEGNILTRILFYPLSLTVRATKIIPKGKLLDIGCGSGEFLTYMKKLGMIVYGVEPESSNDSFAKEYGLNISKKQLKETNYPNDFFDVITMNHAFEHVTNPTETLKEIKRILKKEGTVIIGVPNTNSLAHKLFGKTWVALDVPRHLFSYNPLILKKYAQKVGLKFKKTRYNSSQIQFMASLLYLTNKYRDKKRYLNGGYPLWIKCLFPFFWVFAALCNFLRMGDQFEIFLTK